VEEFQHSGTNVTNQILFRKKLTADLIKGMLAVVRCRILSSSLLSQKIKIKIGIILILRFVLFGCETWSLTLREKRRLRMFENRVLRRVFGPKRDE
jgi:hypothetical protein